MCNLIDTEPFSWQNRSNLQRYRDIDSKRLPSTFYHRVHLLSFHRCFSLVPSRCIPPCNVILCYAHQVCCQNATLLIPPKWLLDRSRNRKTPINTYASITVRSDIFTHAFVFFGSISYHFLLTICTLFYICLILIKFTLSLSLFRSLLVNLYWDT